jgi:hypothetical protein
MKQLIEFPLEDGGHILVEVYEDDAQSSIVRASLDVDETIKKAQQTFESAMDKVKPAASAVIAKIRSLHDVPDEVEVQFGLKLNAEAGAIVASAGVEANYTVTLKWKKEQKKK